MILNSPMLILIVPTCGLDFITLPTSLVTTPPLPPKNIHIGDTKTT